MQKSFRFINTTIKVLSINTDTHSTELEFSDTKVTGLKCLSARTGNKSFLLLYTFHGIQKSISIGKFPDIDVAIARQAARRLLRGDWTPKQSVKTIGLCPFSVGSSTRPICHSLKGIRSYMIIMYISLPSISKPS